jgi:hypothetical protein
MKLPAGINKWGSAALGGVCLLLVANLVAQYRDWQPKHSPEKAALAGSLNRTEKVPAHATDDLSKYDPSVHFDALKKLDSRPLPGDDRNPFDFVGGAAPAIVAGPAPQAPGVVQPPPPPPLPIKAVGYNELPGGKKEAMVTYNDDLEMVHEGDVVGTKYKIVKIDPTMLVVEDGETHKTIELPFQP